MANSYRRGSGVPNPIDIHVGKRIRMRRLLLGMTQDTLATRLGVTFQQLQKYETGFNRVSASRLSEVADNLRVPIGYFFGELDNDAQTPAERQSGRRMALPETLELIRLYYAIPDENVRQQFLAMVKAVAKSRRHPGASGDG
jgi:transcriptional regulator with XRE-family HTH domain